MSMIDFLTPKTADYDYTLEIPAQDIMPISRSKIQILHKFDDGSVSVADVSGKSFYIAKIKFNVLSDKQAEGVLDLWDDPLKANGSERTFYWKNPKDYMVYVVRCMNEDLTELIQHQLGEYTSIDEILLRIEGYKEEYSGL